MHAKPAVLASLVCAALLTAGCDRPQNDATARNDAAAPTRPPSTAMTPAPATTTPPAMAPANNAPTAGEKVADAISDTALTAKVKTALVAEPDLKSTSIEVTTKNAVVTLTGTVPSTNEKEKARVVAQNVEGVKDVVDNLSLKS